MSFFNELKRRNVFKVAAACDLTGAGNNEKGLEWAERAYAINPSICGYNVACAFSMAGNIERALDVLEKHARSSEVHIDWLQQDSDWDTVRNNPRFEAVVDSLRKWTGVIPHGILRRG